MWVDEDGVGPGHKDFEVLEAIAEELLDSGGGEPRVREQVPVLIRRAIDEVIDAPRTGRLRLEEIEKTEKTYIGTKVEILLRDFLGFPKGFARDLKIAGRDVDIKNTIGSNWMIPRESFEQPCLLVAADEKTGICQLGLIVCRAEYLSVGTNRDAKKSIRREAFCNARWILRNEPYPRNFWEDVPTEVALEIMGGESGTERLVRLLRRIDRRAIHRDIVHAVAHQKDFMKRLRQNGGARDRLAAEGIAVLTGVYHNRLVRRLGLPALAKDEVMAVKPKNDEEMKLLRDAGHIL